MPERKRNLAGLTKLGNAKDQKKLNFRPKTPPSQNHQPTADQTPDDHPNDLIVVEGLFEAHY